MSVYRLFWVLLKVIAKGRGSADVYFDTEARTFDYHMARIGSAYVSNVETAGYDWLTLHEERH